MIEQAVLDFRDDPVAGARQQDQRAEGGEPAQREQARNRPGEKPQFPEPVADDHAVEHRLQQPGGHGGGARANRHEQRRSDIGPEMLAPVFPEQAGQERRHTGRSLGRCLDHGPWGYPAAGFRARWNGAAALRP